MRLAIDLGGTHLRVAVRQDAAAWFHLHKERRPVGFSPQNLVERLTALLDGWRVRPAAVGVSVAAVVGDAGYLKASENLGWADAPLGAVLRDAFACPVVVETDVFCGAFYELRAGAAQNLESALYVGVGTAVGHALILGGKVWRGATGAANALGHMVLQPDGALCYCGHRGCLCTVASGLAQSGKTPPLLPLEKLAQAVGAAVTLLEPQAVILSGGALNQPWFELDAFAVAVRRFAYPACRLPKIVRSAATDPNLLGADLLALEQI